MTFHSQDSSLGVSGQFNAHPDVDLGKASLHLIVNGFEKWKLEGFTRLDDKENSYTIPLYENMREVLGSENSSLEIQYPLQVESQYPEYSDGMLMGSEDSDRAGKIDIAIRSWGSKVFFSVECKRLGQESSLDRRYVKEGIVKFIEGIYGARVGFGIMVGYVIRGDLPPKSWSS